MNGLKYLNQLIIKETTYLKSQNGMLNVQIHSVRCVK